MDNWFEELKKNINDFFANSTPEEIVKSLHESGYEHYKNIDKPIFDAHETKKLNAVLWYNTEGSEMTPNYTNSVNYEQSRIKFAAGEYNYQMAA